MTEKPDPFRTLSEEQTRKITSRAIPLVRILEFFRGRGDYVACPQCRELRHPEANVCPHCQREIAHAPEGPS
jgi:uncharacterized OB-fold protein